MRSLKSISQMSQVYLSKSGLETLFSVAQSKVSDGARLSSSFDFGGSCFLISTGLVKAFRRAEELFSLED